MQADRWIDKHNNPVMSSFYGKNRKIIPRLDFGQQRVHLHKVYI
jgi:hypothetical protein